MFHNISYYFRFEERELYQKFQSILAVKQLGEFATKQKMVDNSDEPWKSLLD